MKKNKILISNIWYYISLIPLIIYNFSLSYIMYQNREINIIKLISYIIIPVLIVLISYLYELIYYKIKKMNISYAINSNLPLLNLLCYLLYCFNSLYVVLGLIILFTILSKLIKVNYICLYSIMIYLITINLNKYINIFHPLIYIGISYILIFFNKLYKKDISLYILI